MFALTAKVSALTMTWTPLALDPSPTPTSTPTSTPTTPPPTGGGHHGKGLCDDPAIGKAICHGVGGVVNGALDQMAKEFQEGEVKLVSYLTSWWVRWPTATPKTDANGNAIGPVGFVIGHTAWLVGLLAVFGLLLAAARIAWERRGEAARQAVSGLVTLTVVTGCAVVVVQMLTQAGDSYSNWIINQSLNQSVVNDTQINEQLFQTKMAALTSLANSSLSTALVLILAIFAIVSMLIQLVMMVARIAMVALLTGLLPIGAAVSGTPDGRAMFKKAQGWLIAFILYKPVAATIYAFAFAGMGTIGKDATTRDSAGTAQLVGVVTIILAVLALPALMRFIVPMVSATTTGPGGSASAALAGAAVATGARMLGSGSKGSQDGGGGSQSSPQGSAQTGGRSQPGQGGGGSTPNGVPKGLGPSGNGSTPSGTANGGPNGSGGGGGGGGGSGSTPSGSGGGGGGAGLAVANEIKERAVDYSKNAADRVHNSTLDEDGPSGGR